MKKSAFFLALLVFVRLGFGFSSASGTSNISNFFLGPPSLSQSSLNQVLQLLIGPTGSVGPAGVAGANGLNGINGTNGINGAVGPAGPAGPAGANGAAGPAGANGAAGPAGANGAAGPAGANGAAGIAGPAGANGAPGPAGPVSTISSIPLGSGSAGIGSCTPSVKAAVAQSFSGGVFHLSTLKVSGISSDCSGKTLKIFILLTTDGLTSDRTVSCTSPQLGPWDMPTTPTFDHSFTFSGTNACTLTPGDSAINLTSIRTEELLSSTPDVKTIGVSFE